MEKDTIDEWLNKDADDFSGDVLKNIAERNQETLEDMPEDVASQVKELEQYEFLNTDAQKKFLELLNDLRKSMASTFFNNIENMVNNLSDGDIERMKDMMKALNDMLVKKIAGEDPGFDDFMKEFGDMFGDNPPQSLDELLDADAAADGRRAVTAEQPLAGAAGAAAVALSDRFNDPELNAEMAKLAKEMAFLNPDGNQYRFSGDERLAWTPPWT